MPKKKLHLLTVDWDYFFPDRLEPDPNNQSTWLFDWGHREAPIFAEGFLWDQRGYAFQRRGLELPGTSGEETHFWNQFRFSPHARLYVSDSHACAAGIEVAFGMREVWNFDAHHDLGYRGGDRALDGSFDCGNWLQVLAEDLKVTPHVRYPQWKQDAFQTDQPPKGYDVQFFDAGEDLPVFDRVHICRSSAWTPPWLDQQFLQFIEASGLKPERVSGPDLSDPFRVREFDPEQAAALQARHDAAMDALQRA